MQYLCRTNIPAYNKSKISVYGIYQIVLDCEPRIWTENMIRPEK